MLTIPRAFFISAMSVALLTAEATTPAWSGSGDSYGGGGGPISSSNGMSAANRAKLEAALKAGIAKSKELERKINYLNKALQAARVIDFTLGLRFSLIPYGGFVYSSSKTVGYTVQGEYKEAAWSAVGAVLSGTTSFTGQALDAPALASKALVPLVGIKIFAEIGSFTKNAIDAVVIGADAGEAFAR